MSATLTAPYQCIECETPQARAGFCVDCKARFAAEGLARRARKRRERIATAVLAGLAHGGIADSPSYFAAEAVKWADALIAELDKA